MIRIIALAVVAMVAGVLALAATRPDSFRVQRSASIQAPPERIFALLNDFSRWSAWSRRRVHLFFDMDRMVGADFEAGLANLKALAEQ